MTNSRSMASRLVALFCALCLYAASVKVFTASVVAAEPKTFSDYDSQIQSLLSQMTLEEKVGQMTQAEISALGDLTDIKTYYLGRVLSGGNADPKEGNSLAAWTDAYDHCQQQAITTRLGIPILYGIDA